MSFAKKTVRDVQLKNKTVLLRADYNVPLEESGSIRDDYRMKQSVSTIEYLKKQGAKVVVCSHLGRPEGKPDSRFTLEPVAKHLQKLISAPVFFEKDCIGASRNERIQKLRHGDVLLLENVRFYPGEEANDAVFAKELSEGIDIFVQDGFGVVHRKHASTHAITGILPSVSGLLLEKEINAIASILQNPKRPLMAIVGGAKIADKIDVLKSFINLADFLAVGGAMANTFLLAEGLDVGKSKVDKDDLPLAQDILALARKQAKKRKFTFYLPQDSVVASALTPHAHTRIVDWDTHVIANIENYPRQAPKKSGEVQDNELILDIGPFSGAFIAGSMQFCDTVIWNGVMGVTETPSIHGPVGPFAHGTEIILDALTGQFGNRPYSLIGGGDTAGYLEQRNLVSCFNHVSTGGGATLEFMAGKKLPGVEALQDKK